MLSIWNITQNQINVKIVFNFSIWMLMLVLIYKLRLTTIKLNFHCNTYWQNVVTKKIGLFQFCNNLNQDSISAETCPNKFYNLSVPLFNHYRITMMWLNSMNIQWNFNETNLKMSKELKLTKYLWKQSLFINI